MKYLMQYESVNGFEKIEDEIRSLFYILEDDSISVRITYENFRSTRAGTPNAMRIHFQVHKSKCTEPHKGSVTSWIRYLNNSEEFLEFLHRVSEICNKLGFRLFTGSNISDFGADFRLETNSIYILKNK